MSVQYSDSHLKTRVTEVPDPIRPATVAPTTRLSDIMTITETKPAANMSRMGLTNRRMGRRLEKETIQSGDQWSKVAGQFKVG